MKLNVQAVGGPCDGQMLDIERGEPKDMEMVNLQITTEDEDGPAVVEEPYILRWVRDPGDPEDQGEWWAVWPPLLRPEPPEAGPDAEAIEHMRAAHAQLGGTLLTVPCAPGDHDWTPWVQTPRGNAVRRCKLCQIGQARLY